MLEGVLEMKAGNRAVPPRKGNTAVLVTQERHLGAVLLRVVVRPGVAIRLKEVVRLGVAVRPKEVVRLRVAIRLGAGLVMARLVVNHLQMAET